MFYGMLAGIVNEKGIALRWIQIWIAEHFQNFISVQYKFREIRRNYYPEKNPGAIVPLFALFYIFPEGCFHGTYATGKFGKVIFHGVGDRKSVV